MSNYTQMLFALDLLPDDDNPLADRVQSLCSAMGATLSIVHVVEQISYSYGEPFVSVNYLDWQQELEDTAKKALQDFGKRLGVPEERQYLGAGRPQDEVLKIGKKISADIIVVGSHGRHGLQKLMLGSTANAIIQHAECDVLAVRV